MNIKTLIVLLLALICTINAQAQQDADTTKVFKYVEQMPTAPYNVNHYIARTVQYPIYARDNDIQGKVMVQFIIDEQGNITNVEVTNKKAVHPLLQKEAIRVVSLMPKWIPGKHTGQDVRVFYILPIVFILEDDTPKKKKRKKH